GGAAGVAGGAAGVAGGAAGGVPGRLIALEGGEGCGKSTQAKLLADALGAVLTREPGGTPLGERIRSLLLDPESPPIGPRAELLLMAAARAEHVRTVVRPALEEGRFVVTDRFEGSSLAYQAYGRGLDRSQVAEVSAFATDGLHADLNLLLDLPVDEAESRRCRTPDRIEAADDGFHQRVRSGFAALAGSDPGRWAVVDATGSVEAVARRVMEAVRDRLGLATQDPG
ncbi:MAG TPA: dTMP kinase, partial [Acidimicrobiales bacterium]|nr:dTMP kinase [Acidimicrobiales bacterium]